MITTVVTVRMSSYSVGATRALPVAIAMPASVKSARLTPTKLMKAQNRVASLVQSRQRLIQALHSAIARQAGIGAMGCVVYARRAL